MPEERSRADGNRFLPNVPVVTHEGRRAMFYDDLVRDRIVLVGFATVAGGGHERVARNLARVQGLLGRRPGREATLYTVTVDPARDTPAVLAAYARRYGAGPRWLFLTGEDEALAAIRGAFFADRNSGNGPSPRVAAHAGHHGHAGGGERHDCSMGLLRYGNDAAGVWASVAALAEPGQIVERLDSIRSRPPRPAGTPVRRGGPRPLRDA